MIMEYSIIDFQIILKRCETAAGSNKAAIWSNNLIGKLG